MRQSFRFDLYYAQNRFCPGCGKIVPIEYSKSQCSITVDHVYPLSKGYTHIYNSLFKCGPCNNKKGSEKPSAIDLIWLDYINNCSGIYSINPLGNKPFKGVDSKEVLGPIDYDVFGTNKIMVPPRKIYGNKYFIPVKQYLEYRNKTHEVRNVLRSTGIR